MAGEEGCSDCFEAIRSSGDLLFIAEQTHHNGMHTCQKINLNGLRRWWAKNSAPK